MSKGFLRDEAIKAMREPWDEMESVNGDHNKVPDFAAALDGLLSYLKGGLEDVGMLREGYVAVVDIVSLINALSEPE